MAPFTPQGDIDLKGIYDIKNPATGGDVTTTGSPVDNEFAKFTDASTIEGRSYSEVRSDLNIEDGADVTDATNVANAGAAMSGGAFHDGFSDFVGNEHLDWTADLGATNIHAGNYNDTNTQLSDGDIAGFGYTKDVEVDWTASQSPAVIHADNYTDTGDTTAHASFSQLDFASAGHTGFAAALGADDNYVTDAEKTVIGNTSGANTGDQSIPTVDDTAYNATSWDANADAATKNAIRDKVETMDSSISSNTTNSHASGSDDQSAGDFAHNSLSGLNDGTTYEHLSSAQVSALHTAGTDPNDHASGSDDQDISGIGTNATAIGLNTTHRGSAGGTDHSDVNTNNGKVSYTKTNVKGHINHGSTAGTARPSGFTSVEWIGDVEPSNAVNGDTWIDTT